MNLQPIDEYVPSYWEGPKNILIRYYVYAQRGLSLINDFKYLVAGIMAGYVILKFASPIWMLWIGLISLPILILIGRWQLHKVQKVSEWVGTQFGSVTKYNSYNMSIRQLEILEEILKILRDEKK